ncbi:hypothetical protein HYS54_05025 [Candidatus Micrarchaeota archaeon]|nr:hypothetical protein [Candidatus Micrarchaeota archaeon]
MDDAGQSSLEYLIVLATVVLLGAVVAFTGATFGASKPALKDLVGNYHASALKVVSP